MNKRFLTLFPLTAIAAAVGIALAGCGGSSGSDAAAQPTAGVEVKPIASVAFTDTPAPTASEVGKMSQTYTTSVAKVTYTDGSTKDFPLSYNTLFSVNQTGVGGNKNPSGQLYDDKLNPLMDPYGKPLVAETPDANSLLNIDGNLWLVTHYEYDWILSDGVQASKTVGWYSRAPMSMTLSGISQDKGTGKLNVASQKPIDFSAVNGLWIPCFGSQTPWNTHLGSEEDYDMIYNPLTKDYTKTSAGVKAMTELYFKNTQTANPYNYGWIPEVTVAKDGSTKAVKHYAMGRGTWEMAKVMPDKRTVYLGDDGTNVQLTMFVADAEGNLDAGNLYTAKWTQVSDQDGGRGDLSWVHLGHATSAEVRKLLDDGVTFDKIFSSVAFDTTAKTCTPGYTHIRAGSSADECIKLNPGMEQAAAFIETRRYTALLGGTTEFNKMEGVAVNAQDNKLYLAISYLDKGMTTVTGAPTDDIRLPKINAGATFTLDMKSGQKDKNGNAINSNHVAVNMYVEPMLLGKDIPVDAKGNTADENRIANTDNIFFSEGLRTLFVGEDSGTHVNNYVWAYNVDTKKLTRILSSTAGAENTGLQVLDDLNGFGYIMGNNQHWGDLPSTVPAALKTELAAKIDKFYAPVGYIGGLPAIK
jgi:secreted PhoX family phosphatase